MNGSDTVDQAIFANNAGVKLTRSSDPERAGRWNSYLESFVRLQRFQGRPPPRNALSYHRLDGDDVAILYRHRTDDGSPARNPSRALVGAAADLTVPVALGLRDDFWPKLPSGDPLDKVTTDSVVQCGRQSASPLLKRGLGHEQILVNVVASLIGDPVNDMAVVGCPQEDVTAVLLAVHEVVEPYLAHHRIRRDWSFSTYETGFRTQTGAPSIVFLPGRPDGQSTTRNVVMATMQATANAEDTTTARRLVEAYRSLGSGQVDYSTFPAPAPAQQTVPAFAGEAPPATSEPAHAEPGQSELAAVPGGSGHPASDPRLPVRRQTPGPPPGPPPQPRPSSNGSPGHPGPADWAPEERRRVTPPSLERVLSAQSQSELIDELTVLAADRGPESRVTLRSDLGNGVLDDVLAAITLRTSEPTRTEARKHLLVAMFGPDHQDLNWAIVQTYAAGIIETSPSEVFVAELVTEVGRSTSGYTPVGAAVVRRYLAQHDLPSYEVRYDGRGNGVGASAAPAHQESAGGFRLSTRGAVIGAVIAALVVFGLAIVAGLIVASLFRGGGSGAAAQPEAGSGQPATTATLRFNQDAIGDGRVPAIVTLSPDGRTATVAEYCTLDPGTRVHTCVLNGSTDAKPLIVVSIPERPKVALGGQVNGVFGTPELPEIGRAG